jgi:hypothetical protein
VSSRKEQKERLRAERLEREAAAAAGAARRRRMGLAVAGALVAAVLVAVAVIALAGGGSSSKGAADKGSWPSGSIPPQKQKDLTLAAKAAGCVIAHPKSEGRGHTTKHVDYKTQPPTSGPHFPSPTHDGAYLNAPVPYEALVHALEHGRVVFWFKPNAPASVRGALKKLYDEDPSLVILTPNPRPMPYQVAATAWTELIGCPAYNDKVPDALRAFAFAHRLKGPEYFPQAE